MQCPHCRLPMTLLFYSYRCDYCEGIRSLEPVDRGWLVFERGTPGHRTYVFKTRADAIRWRTAKGLEHCEIVEVLSLVPIVWRESTGALKHLTFGEQLFELDKLNFPTGSARAYYVPTSA